MEGSRDENVAVTSECDLEDLKALQAYAGFIKASMNKIQGLFKDF